MSWQKETHEKRLDRFEQRILVAQFDSRIMTCRSKAVEARVPESGEVENLDDPILAPIEDAKVVADGQPRGDSPVEAADLLAETLADRLQRLAEKCPRNPGVLDG